MPTVRSRGKLPHWEENHAIYFVTFRLADSLPQSVLRKFEFERTNILSTAKAAKRQLTPFERNQLEELFSEDIERKLDTGAGRCFLADSAVADVVAETLQHFDRVRYHLYAWCVMPNHVHVIFRLVPTHELSDVLHTWKSYSSKKANRLLRRSGKLWQHEYYDHLIRSEQEFYRTVQYIMDNPKKAGLRDWRWVGTVLDS
jgi:menaquinone-specific isochorismate synthase